MAKDYIQQIRQIEAALTECWEERRRLLILALAHVQYGARMAKRAIIMCTPMSKNDFWRKYEQSTD
jgi:hypothetical protein